ncbi:MAG: alanine racemase [Candidatus Terrybacteria bacterium RIFCSPLOWO2_01_FULL_44_24]|uniref:Alanine racemase n=1 Tax=Candidatus Terrybacteria bacterium RIFCSPHIGHO2_01_FULL_43_35 TaxID=1802361 RepID=A0A1G2PFH1_9BACT|nr:MAG: alanine racemase [Candidatus Terrybacteria bacterium RIFCSPHIGHO2_01_FULL_43_35]OHA49924.1 MAG: alanine racemase [Candidatus Terrybacteria bacterium RIFCSPHIGHO2_02_FULL_43_14]OHA51755.1 MAG: alanine racemase [Candidatus Terrybacteria bacterium RIFCSPLOWO2_01_FULL_44_24]
MNAKVNHNLRNWVEISKSALLSSIYSFRSIIGQDIALMAVVKANAYGHGLNIITPLVQEAGSVSWLGVDSLSEALACRESGASLPILILGYTTREDLSNIVNYDFRQAVYDLATLNVISFEAKRLDKKAFVHLKIETGTNRQGVGPDELDPFIEFFNEHPEVILEGVYTHFADVESEDNFAYAQQQLAEYQRALQFLIDGSINIPFRHTASSAAILLVPESHLNMVRLGISLYGLWPSKDTKEKFLNTGRKMNLSPVLQWKTVIAQVKNIKKDQPIGYGLTERVSRDSVIAVLPVGYYDGYDRKLSSVGEVLVHGARAKVLGRICMNMFMIDITDIDGVMPEDEVVLLGSQGAENITAEELAQKVDTINYEIVARINPLIPRIIVD